jgi:hypothetical protein
MCPVDRHQLDLTVPEETLDDALGCWAETRFHHDAELDQGGGGHQPGVRVIEPLDQLVCGTFAGEDRDGRRGVDDQRRGHVGSPWSP